MPAKFFQYRRDYVAGALIALLGAGVTLKGSSYRIGTLVHMGPGWMPTALGIALTLLGIAIAITATLGPDDSDQSFLPKPRQWLGWLCVLAGPFLFIVCGTVGGMIPAIFSCVFVSALGDRDATWKSSFMLATGITVFGVLLFGYLLQVPMPLLEWRLP